MIEPRRLVFAVAFTGLLAGCVYAPPPPVVVYRQAPVVIRRPPPPQPIYERPPPPPIAHPYWQWQPGHWRWDGYRWAWLRGHYVERIGY